jgi:hypothetical protein
MPRQRFLSTVLNGLSGNAETTTAARASLGEKLDRADPSPNLLEESAARFEAADRRPPWLGRTLRRALLVGAVVMALWPTAIRTE